MDFEEDQSDNFNENKQSYEIKVKDDCKAFSYSCNFFPEPVDTSNMTKDICDLFIFNVKILNLTEKLWRDILSILELQHVLTKKNLCYSIIDAADCSVLNKNYNTFSYSLLKIQRHNINSTIHRDYLDLLDDLLNCMDRFLTPTLPRLLRNVEHLIIKIQKSENEKFVVTSHKGENFGFEINNAIYDYIKQLRQSILDFKIFQVPAETLKKKFRIEYKMENAFKTKRDLLEISFIEKSF
ncbi:hypothetical protein NBO_7g0042 [Nosema bombycis CQ1]|uniref:Uncharacterized protein n=1 Tax=Nosema bombycis (strain CQ1 / CVCC 102059) TaxID=578461 RepID=R0MB78_NOSB1|nr:hypothetical protein NBO_7g0042 [Nosema bombycis CQ1]|eukprot:EOB15224.1 hypothetical protein NBO_7g0042 [Nosema bombycis CQ1]